MRKIYKMLAMILTVGLFSACSDFFDQVPTDRLSTEKIFETKSGTDKYLASVYTFIPDEANQRMVQENSIFRTAGPWTAGCDEAEYVWGFVTSHNINTNTFIAAKTNTLTTKLWKGWYVGIHNATIFMKNCHSSDDVTDNDVKQYTAEARALRAIYYFYLFRTYGPVPILGEDIISLNASFDEVQLPRNTVDECINYIVSELTKAQNEGLMEHTSKDILGKPTNSQIGRIDQTVAQAFKTEALMLKASPLFNGSSEYYKNLKNLDGTLLFPQGLSDAQKVARWQEAADAAGEFLSKYENKYYDLERVYVDPTTKTIIDPLKSYRQALRGAYSGLSSYKELIFYRIDNSTTTMQYDRTPYHKNAPNDGYRAAGNPPPVPRDEVTSPSLAKL